MLVAVCSMDEPLLLPAGTTPESAGIPSYKLGMRTGDFYKVVLSKAYATL